MAEEIIPDDVKQTIKETFQETLKEDVVIEVFTESGKNDQFNEVAVALVRSLAPLSEKLKVSFHTIGDEQSVKRNVTRSPSILIAPDKYRIRFTGAPVGEEGRSFLTAIIMASTGKPLLSEQSVKQIAEQLHEKRDIQVFVSPTCPYCPQQVLSAFSAAIVKPDLVSAEAVEIYENRDLAESLGSLAVPQTFMNNTFTGAGLQPEPLFMESLLTLKEPVIASTQISGEPVEKDLVIIGGGPAGLTAAIYAVRAGLDSVVIEKSNLGGQVMITPVVENYPGFMRIGGKSLIDLMAQQAAQYAELHVGEFVTEVTKDPQDGTIHLKTNHAIYITRGAVDRNRRRQPRARSNRRSEILRQGRKLLRDLRRVLLQGREIGPCGGWRQYGTHGRALSSQPRCKGDPRALARYASRGDKAPGKLQAVGDPRAVGQRGA